MPETQDMLTTKDLASRLRVSEDTALRLMQKTPGVVRLGSGSRSLYRMPEKVFDVLVMKASKGGRKQ
jgi:hypothetical protein